MLSLGLVVVVMVHVAPLIPQIDAMSVEREVTMPMTVNPGKLQPHSFYKWMIGKASYLTFPLYFFL